MRDLHGQRGPETGVWAGAERQMLARHPPDIEALPVGEVSSTSVGRRDAELHYVPLLDGIATQLEVL